MYYVLLVFLLPVAIIILIPSINSIFLKKYFFVSTTGDKIKNVMFDVIQRKQHS